MVLHIQTELLKEWEEDMNSRAPSSVIGHERSW
jgi:hypothetical protein